MKSSLQIGAVVVATMGLLAGQAQAAKLCKLTGSYSDDYGSTTSITGKKGSIQNGFVCATAYTFRISDETATGFTVTGKNPTKSCGKFSANLTFGSSCSVFSGTVTIDGSQLSDTFTLIENTNHRAPVTGTDMTDGLR